MLWIYLNTFWIEKLTLPLQPCWPAESWFPTNTACLQHLPAAQNGSGGWNLTLFKPLVFMKLFIPCVCLYMYYSAINVELIGLEYNCWVGLCKRKLGLVRSSQILSVIEGRKNRPGKGCCLLLNVPHTQATIFSHSVILWKLLVAQWRESQQTFVWIPTRCCAFEMYPLISLNVIRRKITRYYYRINWKLICFTNRSRSWDRERSCCHGDSPPMWVNEW